MIVNVLCSRKRKIRCDGAKPTCHNCTQRSVSGATECSYDSAPRRRGPDRLPGARSRRGVGEPPVKRRRRRSEHEYEHNQHEFDYEWDEGFDGQGDDPASGGLVEVGKGDCGPKTYTASSVDTNNTSPVSATGRNRALSLSVRTSIPAQAQSRYASLYHSTEPVRAIILAISRNGKRCSCLPPI